MKVGILTFHNAINYGAVLQAYATQIIVSMYGHDVEIIDYQNSKISKVYGFGIKRFLTKHINEYPQKIVENIYYYKRLKEFERFRKDYLHLSKKRYLQNEDFVIDDYDLILIGSDQLWNIGITGGYDNMFWGNFETSQNTKKIAWSICMNNKKILEKEKEFVLDSINHFSAISVREKSLQTYLYELTNIKYPQTLDPTLVLPSEKWEELCHPVEEKNYILVYAIQDENEVIDFSRKIAKNVNKNLIIVRSNIKWYFCKGNKEYCGPIDFLSYIRNADLVITTSFHGTAFSIELQKQFVSPAFHHNSRVESLLSLLELDDRRIVSCDDYFNLDLIDYKKVIPKLEEARHDTKVFLKKNLS